MNARNTRLSGEVLTELQKYAVGFERPDTAIRRILGMQPRSFNGQDSETMELWELKTDPDLVELAENLAGELEERLGDYQEELGAAVESLVTARETVLSFPEYERLTNLAGRVVLELVSEHLMSAYKQPSGDEDEGGEETDESRSAAEDARREDHPSNQQW